MRSCADVPTERFAGSLKITGTVRDGTGPVRAYVRLLDRTGDFVAELPTDRDGGFTFYAVPGDWSLRLISAAATADVAVRLIDADAPALDLVVGAAGGSSA
jgi:hypothetical protein